MILVLAVFYLLVELYPRNLINWGFLLIITILIYVEVSTNNVNIRKRFWNIMIFYSSLIMAINILFLFF